MNYVIKDHNGEIVGQGNKLTDLEETDIPTHGSVSLDIGGGRWLNLLTSEWLIVKITGSPEGWPKD